MSSRLGLNENFSIKAERISHVDFCLPIDHFHLRRLQFGSNLEVVRAVRNSLLAGSTALH